MDGITYDGNMLNLIIKSKQNNYFTRIRATTRTYCNYNSRKSFILESLYYYYHK